MKITLFGKSKGKLYETSIIIEEKDLDKREAWESIFKNLKISLDKFSPEYSYFLFWDKYLIEEGNISFDEFYKYLKI